MKKLLLLPLVCVLGLSQAQTFDSLEYASGNLTAKQQLLSYPLPRYKPGHTLNRNFIWFGIDYFSGFQQPNVSRQQMINDCKTNTEEFYKNWNYYFMVSQNIGSYSSPSNYADTLNVVSAALTAVAKRNPSYKTSAICFWPQINGNVTNRNLSANHYLKNASGQYLTTSGATTTTPVWSPVAPDASVIADGQTQRARLQNLVTALGRPVDILNENGECLPLISKNGVVAGADPAIQADYNSLGLPSVNDYRGFRYAHQTKLYRDQFMSASPGTKFTHYALDGQIDYRPLWQYSKSINSSINGKYYPTGDFYPRWPNNWKAWAGAWHGLGWFADCKYHELQNGDDLMSPFVSAGWNIDETVNVRPAQYLAMLKVLSAWGSEFFYTGYFSLAAPFPDSKNWGWQTVMPVYAQAITSRYENYLRQGSLLTGDVPRYFLSSTTLTPNNPKYLFHTGDQRQLVAIRKLNGVEKYVITTAQMVDANTVGNAPMTSFGKFKLNNDSLMVEFRRQGSVYIYDASNPSSKVFYQLDGWHQYEHPERWSKDLPFEAELYDNTNSSAQIKTEVPAGTLPGDYRVYTSYVSFTSATPPALEYNFTPRGTNQVYVWVRARSKNTTGGSISVNISGSTAKSIGCITNTGWQWFSLDACTGQGISFNNLTTKEYILSLLVSNSNIEIDRILLTGNANLNLNPNQAPCGTSVASISASGSTTFCQGGSVTLTAQSGGSYTWSNGQTTQAITVTQAGTYSVAVNNGTGCAAVSAPVSITVNAAPAASIMVNGSTTFCQGQSRTLTASPGASYAWSTGSTNASISVNSSGNYSVTVTGANGCSATSGNTAISVTAAPSGNVSANGPTSFCQGGSVQLTAAPASTYLWSSGQTTQSITVNQSGNFSVTVSNGGGCSASSTPVPVTVSALPTASISTNGSTSICQGQTRTLTASGGTAYAWSTGATTQSIVVSNSGNYQVTVTGSSNCTATSATTAITVNPSPSASITSSGPTSFCQGGSVVLSAPSGYSYSWSTGSTSRQITVNTTGTYNVTVTSGANCSAVSTTTSVNVMTNPSATISAAGSTNICQGASVQLNASGADTYVWSNGQTGNSINVNAAGNYSAIATGANGCTSVTNSVAVSSVSTPVPTITVTGPTSLASGQSTTLVATGGSTYTWQPGGQTGSSIVVTTPGNYTVTASNAAGCSGTSALVTIGLINSPTPVSISSSSATSFCAGGSVMLNANGGSNPLWSPGGDTTRSISVSQSGLYFVYSRDNNGTVLSVDSILVTVHPRPLNPTISITYVPNTTFQLNAFEPSAVSYLWSNGATSPSVNIVNPTLMTVTVRNAFGCSSGSASLQTASVMARTCIAPNMLTHYDLSDTTAMLGWNPAITGEKYIVRYWEVGTANIETVELGGNFSTVRVRNLAPGTSYNWHAEVVCSSGSYTSITSSFKTLGTPLSCGSIPQHQRTENISTNRALARWYNTTADSITVRYRAVGATTFQFRKFSGITNATGGQLNNLQPNTTYEWQVSTLCSGYNSPYSRSAYFTTLDTCGHLGLVTIDNINTTTARIRWSNTQSMDTIRIRLVSITTGGVRNIYIPATTLNGSFELRGLKPAHSYYVELRGKCGGTAGNWTSPVSFTTTDINVRVADENMHLNGYPNPASDILFFSFTSEEDADYRVKVCDMAGRELMQEARNATKGSNASEIPVNSYAKGAYLLIVEKGTQRSHFRFTVQ